MIFTKPPVSFTANASSEPALLNHLAKQLHYLREDNLDEDQYKTDVTNWLVDVWVRLKVSKLLVVPFVDSGYGNEDFALGIAWAWVASIGKGLVLQIDGAQEDLVTQTRSLFTTAANNPTKRYSVVVGNAQSNITTLLADEVNFANQISVAEAPPTVDAGGNPLTFWPPNLVLILTEAYNYTRTYALYESIFRDKFVPQWSTLLMVGGLIGSRLVNNYIANTHLVDAVIPDVCTSNSDGVTQVPEMSKISVM